MITLTCTQCHATLEMDEAFAGGACRCQHCGTIQTVPSHLKQKAMSGGTAGTKTLHVQPTRPDAITPSSGLDELADIVVSSGLSSRRLRHAPPETVEAPPPPQKSPALPLLIIGAVVVLIAGAGIWFALTRGSSKSVALDASQSNVPAVREPNFCGVKLDLPSVVYVIDRGDSTRDQFGFLKEACYRSIESLGSDRKFQVVFWNNGSEDGYPARGIVYATKDNVQACKVSLEEISAYGQTDVTSALTKAVSSNPSAIVLATGKAWQLDESFARAVEEIRGDKQIKMHTFAIGEGGSSPPLREIATKTGGNFRAVTPAELRAAAQ